MKAQNENSDVLAPASCQKPGQARSSGLDSFWPSLSFEKAQAIGLGHGLGALKLNFFVHL